ncbi:uncharacterized protein LOC114542049 [Dendronephthya gigantea]|uniref:uncharacterized protein LOC114542049 n=1 Tax=Dendronephthya gigantea TaxID=151771 RepID=UPI0010699CC3|nr:uncharacterized protein LOC114542049 [Dendronephthya gigantea]
MANVWSNIFIFVCVVFQISAIPLRIATKKGDDNNVLERVESNELERSSRTRRTENSIPLGCESGSTFGLASVPHCLVTDAEYHADMKLCLVQLIHVPGMPDGRKGYNYVAHNHFLYKAYNATNTLKLVKCPTPVPTTENTRNLSMPSKPLVSNTTSSPNDTKSTQTTSKPNISNTTPSSKPPVSISNNASSNTTVSKTTATNDTKPTSIPITTGTTKATSQQSTESPKPTIAAI